MEQVGSRHVTRWLADAGGKTLKELSAAIGRCPSYLSTTIKNGSNMRSDRVAGVAKACGGELRLVRGDEVIVVRPE